MRSGFAPLIVCVLMACGTPVPGGTGGSGASGGTGGDSCPDCPRPCEPSCDAGEICVSGACVEAYTGTFMSCPPVSGRQLKVQLEFRPAQSGEPALAPSQIVVHPVVAGSEMTPTSFAAVAGQDNLFEIDLDLSTFDKVSGDELPFSIDVHRESSNDVVTCQGLIDDRGPQVVPDLAPRTPFRRDQPVTLTASVFDVHLDGGAVMARLQLPGDPAPAAPNVSPAGWSPGTQVAGRTESFRFALDQSQVPLPQLDGTFVAWFWALDGLGNTTLLKSDAPDHMPAVTRKAWSSAHPLPGAPLAPAVDAQDRVGVLLPGTTDNFAVYDGVTGHEDRYSMPGSTPPVVGANGDFYAVSLDHIATWRLDAGTLAPVSNCATAAAVSSPPTVLSTGTMELAAYSRTDGVLANIGADPACIAERVTTTLGATDSPPAAGVALSGRAVLVIGGHAPNTLSTFTVVTTGALTRPYHFAPPGLEALGGVPLAIDGDTVLAAPRYRNQAMAFRFASGYDQAPTLRSLVLENVANDGIGPPIVSAHAAVFPTAKGLRALPRSTSWTQDAVFAAQEAFDAPPLAGKGDILYAVNRQGLLHVLSYSENPDPALTELWSAQIGSGETFSVSPALTCHGILVLVSDQGNVHALAVDSLGLDDQAPWPKVLHDGRNTASAGTALACTP